MFQPPDLWNDPPWAGGTAKHRLGLRPVGLEGWFSVATDDWRTHKERTLAERYDEAVARAFGAEPAQTVLAEVLDINCGKYPDKIADAAMVVPDDLCLIDVDDAQRLVAGCVCSPSYWRLQDKMGLPLVEVHAPVQGLNAKIGDAIARFVQRSPPMQPFERRNWFMHGDDGRFHDHAESTLSPDVSSWFVRSERQTLCRISQRFLLFTINVQCAALAEIRSYPVALNDLVKSLGGMDQQEVEHFGGRLKHRRLVAWLENAT